MAKKESKIKVTRSSGNVYADMGYPDPEKAKLKFELSVKIAAIIKGKKLTQEQAAKIMNTDQPKVSKVVRGILSDFSIETLVYFLVALGYNIEIRLTPSRIGRASIHVVKNQVKRVA